ncbi:MAG TPA: ABC transporter permease [Clostridiales bacterium]|nr:ABC transporter permease [Clostridiales bacterium]
MDKKKLNKTKTNNSYWKEIIKRFKKNKMAMLGLSILIILITVAIFADQLAQFGYDEQNAKTRFLAPSSQFPLGTDNFGRDILSRIIYGARISLQVGLISVAVSCVLGGSLGIIAAYYGGKLDNIIMRVLDVLLAIPGMILAVAIAASLGPGLNNMMLAIGLGHTPGFARVVRASVLTVKEQEYIDAARLIGDNDLQIIFRHILPNSMAPMIVQATLNVGRSVISAASLSFLGLGIQPPIPEWGSMLASARAYLRDFWWLTTFPGLAIMLTVFSLNLVGDGLRDALDPRLKS